MGSSSSFNGGGSDGISNGCGDIFDFRLITNCEESILSDLIVEDVVRIELTEGKLPVLEVVTLKDGLNIGIVPPSLSKLISCIKNGWEYYGIVSKIESSEKGFEVYIRIEGKR